MVFMICFDYVKYAQFRGIVVFNCFHIRLHGAKWYYQNSLFNII